MTTLPSTPDNTPAEQGLTSTEGASPAQGVEKPGAAVLVNGQVIAWFHNFDDAAQEWCAQNYFGQWLAWQAKSPELIPLTAEQDAECKRLAEELCSKLNVS